MRKVYQGFTLIELVMLLVVLGVLVSTALPRFYAMQSDTRSIKAESIYGAVRSAAEIAHRVAADNKQAGVKGVVTIEDSRQVTLAYGYPDAGGILKAANIVSGQDGISISGTLPVTIGIDGAATPNCKVEYIPAKSARQAPVITLSNNKTAPGSC